MVGPTTVPVPSTIEVVPHPDTVAVMHLSGALDRVFAPEARAQLVTAVMEGRRNLILDVHDVPTIDGAGVNTLAYGMHRARQEGGGLRIVGATDRVQQRIDLTQHEIPSHATVVEALAAAAVEEAIASLTNGLTARSGASGNG